MKINKEYSPEDLPKEYIILPKQYASHSLLIFGDVRTLLWETLQNDVTENELVRTLISNYNIDEITARRDVKIFIRELIDSKIITNFP